MNFENASDTPLNATGYAKLLKQLLTKGDVYGNEAGKRRIITQLDRDMTIPVMWGSFKASAGDYLAIQEESLADVEEALVTVLAGKAGAENKLLAQGPQGERIARYDVYVLESGFMETHGFQKAPHTPAMKSAALNIAWAHSAAAKMPVTQLTRPITAPKTARFKPLNTL